MYMTNGLTAARQNLLSTAVPKPTCSWLPITVIGNLHFFY